MDGRTDLMNSASARERDVGVDAGMQLTYRDPATDRLLSELELLPTDERMILAAASRDAVSRDAALGVVNRIMNSASTGDRTIGVVLGLQLGHDPALRQLSSELDSLRQDRNFSQINFNLMFLYRRPPVPLAHELWIESQPTEPDPLAILVDLIAQRSSAPGLDQAIAGTLYRIMKRHDSNNSSGRRADLVVDKKVLPAAALLLESSDPKAMQGAARLFHVYTAFARPSTVNQRPLFWTEESRWLAGRSRKDISADDLAAFWLQWWSENREKLGFE